ncbi:MAG: TonB-dependent receptor [Steroidobacteraceae bacterium]
MSYAVALVCLVCGTAAYAQAPPASSQELEEVVVTAQRVETSLQQTPLAVTAITAGTLERQGTENLMDLQTFTPSLEINARPGQGTALAGLAIRGMGVNTTDSNATVGIYVDDVYDPSNYGTAMGLLDVQGIEVLRGPQGTLFGRNSIAGAVLYNTVKPSQTLEGYLEGTVGNENRYEVQGAVNLPIGTEVAIRLSGAFKDLGGYVHDDFNDIELGQQQNRLMRAQLRWTPTGQLTVDLKADYGSMDNNGRPAEIGFVNPNAQFAFFSGQSQFLNNSYLSRPYEVAGYNSPDYFKSVQATYESVVTYQLSDQVTLKWINAYVDNRNRDLSDYDMTPLPILAVDTGQIDDNVWSEELRLTGKTKRWSWTAGAYYANQKTTTNGADIVLGPIVIPSDATSERVRSVSVYAQSTFNFTDQLAAVTGLRYTVDRLAYTDVTADLAPSVTFHDTSPRLGLNYQLAEDIMAYVSAARGFRDGGFSVNSMLPASYNGVLTFQPDTAWTYEAGMRMEFLDRQLRLNPTVFWTDWKNMQFNYLIPNPAEQEVAAVTNNAGDSRIKGLEIESEWLATERLMFTGALSLLDGHYTRISPLTLNTYPLGFGAVLGGVPGSVVTIPNLTLNDPLQQTPKYKIALGAQYTQPLANGSKIIGSLDAAWTAWQSSAVTESDAIRMPGYSLVNGRLQYVTPGGHFSISAYVQNLLNKYYLIGGTGFGHGYTVGNDELIPGRPRQYGVTLRTNF